MRLLEKALVAIIATVIAACSQSLSSDRNFEIPIIFEYDQFPELTDQLSNDIWFGLLASQSRIPPNVDSASDLMVLSVRSLGHQPVDRVEVTYTWRGDVVSTREVKCVAPRFEGCGRRIVEGAEEAARRIRARH
jgi:hypothetical protein